MYIQISETKNYILFGLAIANSRKKINKTQFLL